MTDELYYFSVGVQDIIWMWNVLTFFVYAFDKRQAIYNGWRVPEVILLLLGGYIGALSAMIMFRHKIKKPLFYITIPILLTIQLLSYAFLCWSGVL